MDGCQEVMFFGSAAVDRGEICISQQEQAVLICEDEGTYYATMEKYLGVL